MALSGTISGTYRGWTVRSVWSATQSVAGNYSDITVNHYLDLASGYSLAIGSRTNSCTVNGTTQNFTSGSINQRGGTVHLGRTTYRVGHNTDGTKSCSLSTTFNIQATLSGTYVGSISANGTINLNTIARASQPSINTYPNNSPDFNIGDTITIHMNRASSSFTHTVKFNYGSTSVTVATGVTNNCTFNTSTIADALYALIPNATSYSKTISVTTYNGSTEIGTKTCPYTAKAVPANVTPTFSASYKDTNSTVTAITDNDQQIVRNQSTLQVKATSLSAKKSATISTVTCALNGTTYTGTISGTSCTFNIGTVDIASNATATIKVTDSRGYSASQNLTIQILDWVLPSAIITMQRQNNYYDPTTINVDGSISSVDSKNTMAIKLRYKKVGTSTWSSYVTMQDNVSQTITMDNDFSWDVQVVISDRFGSTTYNLTLNRGLPLAYFDRLRNSVGFNTLPGYDKSVEIAGRLFVENEDIMSKFTGIGGIARSAPTADWNTAGGTLSGIYMGSNMSHAPGNSSNWFFVLHMAHNTLYQRQLAFDFFGLSIYTRRMDNGTWSDWVLLDQSGGIYMEKSVYDTTNTGVVDNAEKVNGKTVLSDVPANAKFTDTTYTAGNGISINNGVISCTFADGDSEAY